MNILFDALLVMGAIGVAVVLIALPAILILPRGPRSGLHELSIETAARQLQSGGRHGWDLVTAAVLLVHERMHYCRRNSFDSCETAFRRGYGYCQQQAYALKKLLTLLGFDAAVVYGFGNQLPSGRRANHAWVQVAYSGEVKNVCSIFTDERGNITFTPARTIRRYTPFFRLFAGWGSSVVNAIAYFKRGDAV